MRDKIIAAVAIVFALVAAVLWGALIYSLWNPR